MANKDERKLIGQIWYVASDKRKRVMLTDQNEWLETKLKEIRRLLRKLPKEKFDPNAKITPKKKRKPQLKKNWHDGFKAGV